MLSMHYFSSLLGLTIVVFGRYFLATKSEDFIGDNICNLTETREEVIERNISEERVEHFPFLCQKWPPWCLNETVVRRIRTITETRNVTTEISACCDGFRQESDPTSPSDFVCVPSSDDCIGNALQSQRSSRIPNSYNCAEKGFYNGFGNLGNMERLQDNISSTCFSEIHKKEFFSTFKMLQNFWKECIDLPTYIHPPNQNMVTKEKRKNPERFPYKNFEIQNKKFTDNGETLRRVASPPPASQCPKCVYEFPVGVAVLFLASTTTIFLSLILLIAFCL